MQEHLRDDEDEARYYFHVENGDATQSDSTGQELESIEQAVGRAMEIADSLESETGAARACVTIEDENGEEIACVVALNPRRQASN